jgi:hypothetical protein
MSKAHAVLKFTRKMHLLLGIFTTPALLFFAFTGAMQTFSLHETTQGSNYKPPAWIASLAQLHKKQDTTVPVRKLRPPTIESGERGNFGKAIAGSASDGASQSAPGQASKTADSNDGKSKSGGPAPAARKSHLPMKIFFLLVAMNLALSTLTGIYMSYKFDRRRWQLTGLLVAGIVVPLLLLPF